MKIVLVWQVVCLWMRITKANINIIEKEYSNFKLTASLTNIPTTIKQLQSTHSDEA